ncbi:MAG: hypothetical protein R3A52_02430 [Polyangiales bacterium]
MTRTLLSLAAAGLFMVGCGDDAPTTPTADSGTTTDLGASTDTGSTADTGAVTDTGSATDAGATDTGIFVDAGPVDVAPTQDATADATTDATADASADAAMDPWACLGMVTAPTAEGTMGTMRVRIANFQSNGALAGVTVKACARTDDTCATPHSTATTDAMGNASLTYPMGAAGFDGYLEVSGGAGANEVTPTRNFFPLPPYRAMEQYSLLVVTRATFTLLSAGFSAMLDATHGAIAFIANDCNGDRSAGISASISPAATGARQFYFTGVLPSLTATQTDATGVGGYLDVAPGNYSVEGRRVSPASRVGAVSLSVRGGYITSTNLIPTP